MKKVLWGIGGLLVAVVVFVLVAPNFIDWNGYKGTITDRAMSATGRNLEILGDIKISVFPAPTVRAEKVRIANVEGAATADMVSLESLEVRVALLPLLSGSVQVQSIKLVDPVINIEKMAGGKTNLVFTPNGPPADPVPRDADVVAPSEETSSAAGAIRIDDLVIENGTVVYRDTPAGTTERVDNLNSRFAAAALNGPMETDGTAVVRGFPISFDISMGNIVHGRTVPLSVEVGVAPGEVKARLSGSIASLRDAPRFKGKLTVKGADLGAFIESLSKGSGDLPLLKRSFGLAADVQANQKSAEVTSIVVNLADTKGTGKISVALADTINAKAELQFSQLDLDALLAAAAKPVVTKKTDGKKVSPAPSPKTPASPAVASSSAAVEFPKNINAELDISVEAITFREALIRQGKFSASLSNGEITLNQLSALLPGGSDFAVFGFAAVGPNGPAFEGNIDMTTNDLRAMMKWAGAPDVAVAPERLRSLKLAGKVVADAKNIRLNEIAVQLDNTRINGAATIALRDRPALGINLVVDSINLDGYLPSAAPMDKSEAKESKGTTVASGQLAPTTQSGPFSALSALGGFDANIKATVGRLTLRDTPVRNMALDATLFNGALALRNFSADDFAGLALKVGGNFSGFLNTQGPIDPTVKGLKIDARGKDLSRLVKMAGITLPFPAKQLGAVLITSQLDGRLLDKLQTTTELRAAGGRFNLDGEIVPLSLSPAVDAEFKFVHPNVVRLARLAGVDYRPSKANFGGLNIAGRLSADLKAATVSNLIATVGPLAAKGRVKADMTGPRPKVDLTLSTNAFRIDDFLPAKRRADLSPVIDTPRVVPTSWRPGEPLSTFIHRIATHTGGRWPTEPIDLSVMRSLDADFKVTSTAISFDTIKVDQSVISGTLSNGVLATRQVTGTVFGGALTGSAQVTEGGNNSRFASKVSVKNLDAGRAAKAAGQSSVGAGKVNIDLDVTSAGGSVAGLISALNGNGALQVNGLDVSGSSGAGMLLAPLYALVGGLNQVFGVLTGGRSQKRGLADLGGTFVIRNGVASFSDFTLASTLGNGGARGTVDLPNWLIDTTGEMQVAQNLLVTKGILKVPFTARGPLDAPNVNFSLPKGGLPIPTDLFSKKGAKNLLKGLLGGGQTQTAPAQQQTAPASGGLAPPPPLPEDQKQQPSSQKPEDIFKGLLRGLAR